MGQILHGCARTTATVRRAIQNSKKSLIKLSKRYDINPKTVQKWRKRKSVEDAAMGPKTARSTVLSLEEEAACVAFRKHTLLSLDDCLYALQNSMLHLSRSALHRLFKRHSINRLPDVDEEKKQKKHSRDTLSAIFTSILDLFRNCVWRVLLSSGPLSKTLSVGLVVKGRINKYVGGPEKMAILSGPRRCICSKSRV